jgi:hypothetical protein
MRSFEIRLVGHTGRVAEVFVVPAESLQDAMSRAESLVKSHPEIAGAQVTEEQDALPATVH